MKNAFIDEKRLPGLQSPSANLMKFTKLKVLKLTRIWLFFNIRVCICISELQ